MVNENSNFNKNTEKVELIEVLDILVVARKNIYFIASVTLAFAIFSIIYAISQPKIYKSEALLSPASQNDGVGKLASQFGGLASIAGVNLGVGGGNDKTLLAIEVLKSREFLRLLLTSYDIKPKLMATKEWNESSNSILFDEELYDSSISVWLKKNDSTLQPSLLETQKVFLKLMSIKQDKDTGFVKLSVKHQSPHFAKFMVDILVRHVNDVVRIDDIKQAEKSIAYLKKEIVVTKLSEIKTGLFELVQSQTQTIMLANASPEYVFKTIDPAVVMEENESPNRPLICILGTLFGFLFALFISLIKHFKAH